MHEAWCPLCYTWKGGEVSSYTCILQYFLQIWPAALVGEVPGLVEVLGVVECTEEIFSLGWRFNTEIGSAHLPGCCMPSPGKIFHRTSVTVPCTHFMFLIGNIIFSNTQHYAVCTCTIGSCMPSSHLRRPFMQSKRQ